MVFTEEALESNIITGGVKHPLSKKRDEGSQRISLPSTVTYRELVKVHSLPGLFSCPDHRKDIFLSNGLYSLAVLHYFEHTGKSVWMFKLLSFSYVLCSLLSVSEKKGETPVEGIASL